MKMILTPEDLFSWISQLCDMPPSLRLSLLLSSLACVICRREAGHNAEFSSAGGAGHKMAILERNNRELIKQNKLLIKEFEGPSPFFQDPLVSTAPLSSRLAFSMRISSFLCVW